MKKLIIILGLLLATGIAFGERVELIGRLLIGDVVAGMNKMSLALMTAEDLKMLEAMSDTYVVAFNGHGNSSGTVIIGKDRVPYVDFEDGDVYVNGKLSKYTVTYFGGQTNMSVVHYKDIKVGNRIRIGNQEFVVSERDVRRFKKIIIKRDVALKFMPYFYSDLHGNDWVNVALQEYPELDLDK